MRGVYAITNVLTDTVYYGQAENIEGRLRTHRSCLARGRHGNSHLQASWNKYGEDAFVFTPLYLIPAGDMTTREKHCIDDAYGIGLRLFNQRVASPSANTGIKFPAEIRARVSAAMKGRALSSAHRANLSVAARHRSPEHLAKIASALRGRRRPPETIAKMSASASGNHWQPVGYKHSPATRAKMVLAWEARQARKDAVTEI